MLPPMALAGCSALPDSSEFDAIECVGGVPSVAGLSPSSPADYVELRAIRSASSTLTRGMAQVLSSRGMRCATALDAAACGAEVDAIDDLGAGFRRICPVPSPECTSYGLVATRGSTVTRVRDKPELLAFMQPIDSRQEALLWAFTEPYDVCNTTTNGVREVPGGYEVLVTRGVGCGLNNDLVGVLLGVSASGALTELQTEVLKPGDSCAIGRRHAGMRPCRRDRAGSVVGGYLAQAARLEAASVDAFLDLGVALGGLGAPRRLVRGAARAAADEIRHARQTGALSSLYGVEARGPSVEPVTAPNLEALALENAVEGCVRETFGALCGAYQAARAADPVVRTTLEQITRDETTHALLSWQIAAWAEPRLDRAALRRVREARRAAIRELRDEAAVAPQPELCATLGVPDAARATVLLGALDQGLWREVG